MLKDLIESSKRKNFEEKRILDLKLDIKNLGQLNRDKNFVKFMQKPNKNFIKYYNLTKATEKMLLKDFEPEETIRREEFQFYDFAKQIKPQKMPS